MDVDEGIAALVDTLDVAPYASTREDPHVQEAPGERIIICAITI